MPKEHHGADLIIDALEHSNWDRGIFEEMREGGVDCAHVTLVTWENARDTLDILGRWSRLLREHSDIIVQALNVEDIHAAREAGKTAILFGFQNASPFEDDLALVEIFHRLGVRVVQLTYNIQNHIGSSCYEAVDPGLSRFGRFVVEEMNRVGMLIDLSHVGERTGLDAINESAKPVAVTHGNLRAVFDHKRNKSDELLKALAERGGMIGCSPYPHLTGGKIVTLEKWCGMVARAVELMGIEHVGIGSDVSRKWTDEFLMWIRMGKWTHVPEYGAGTREQPGWVPWPEWFETPANFPNITQGLKDVGFHAVEIKKLLGENWLRLFSEVFSTN